uniref:Uncharacterized protein n=1 Tax=Glossina pallidipes TaxID=7398 RepID=A0A1A9Z8M3_GLOPL
MDSDELIICIMIAAMVWECYCRRRKYKKRWGNDWAVFSSDTYDGMVYSATLNLFRKLRGSYAMF